jgi:hypothetical protein
MSWYETSFFEHPLRYSKKNVDLSLNSTFFVELELVELYMFGWKFCRVGGVEQFFMSGVLPNMP